MGIFAIRQAWSTKVRKYEGRIYLASGVNDERSQAFTFQDLPIIALAISRLPLNETTNSFLVSSRAIKPCVEVITSANCNMSAPELTRTDLVCAHLGNQCVSHRTWTQSLICTRCILGVPHKFIVQLFWNTFTRIVHIWEVGPPLPG